MTKITFNPVITVEDDNLFKEDVGEWAMGGYY